VCWKPCLSCWSLYLLREEFLSAPIRSLLSGSPFRSFIRRRGQLGKVRRRTRGSPVTVLWPRLGSGVRRRAGSAAPGGSSRCKLASSEAASRPNLYAALEDPEDPSERGSHVTRLRERVGGEAQRWWHSWRTTGRAREQRQWLGREERGAVPFIDGRAWVAPGLRDKGMPRLQCRGTVAHR
jgi:hypothetical protein